MIEKKILTDEELEGITGGTTYYENTIPQGAIIFTTAPNFIVWKNAHVQILTLMATNQEKTVAKFVNIVNALIRMKIAMVMLVVVAVNTQVILRK